MAVLPFQNGDAESRYLCDGIADSIISQLTRIPELRVTSRTSSFQFRNTHYGLKDIAKQLDVRVVVEGSARVIGRQINVLLNIISAERDEVVWSHNQTGVLDDLFELEKEITQSVIENIRDHFSHFDLDHKDLQKESVIGVSDYELFLKANQLNYNWNVGDALKALSLYDEVIGKSPMFFEAYTHKIDCYSYLRAQMAISPEEIDADVSRLMKIMDENDVQSADLQVARAGYHFWGSWNFKAAFDELRVALGLNPSHSEGHNFLALMYALSGKEVAAKRHFEHAIQLDPLSANKHATKAWGMYVLSRFDQALDSYEEAIRLNSKLSGYPIRVKSLIALNQNLDKLYAEVHDHKSIAPFIREGLLGLVAAHADDEDAARLHSKNLIRLYETNQNEQALGFLMQISCRQGNQSKAIKWLKKSYQARHPMLVGLIVDPLLKGLRTHPEFQKIKLRLKPLDEEQIQGKVKDKKTPTTEWITQHGESLIRLMNEEKPYLNPGISLRDLAKSLAISPNSLSWLINNRFEKSFNDYVNGYRIEAFKEKVLDPTYDHLSLLGLALECGFNSKATFNTLFKRVVGMTPSEYKRVNS